MPVDFKRGINYRSMPCTGYRLLREEELQRNLLLRLGG